MDMNNLTEIIKGLMVDENGVGGISIPIEDDAPEPVYNQVQYAQPDYNQVQYAQPVYNHVPYVQPTYQLPPCEFVEKSKAINGESLAVDKNENAMIAISSKVILSRYWHGDKKITSKDFRMVSEGYVESCKKYNYICEDGVKFFYKITTNGEDKNTYSFELSQKEFNGNLLKVLTEKGKLKFKRYSVHKNDADLVRDLIMSTAKEVKTPLPYMPRWKKCKYLYASRKHVADTPFFNNIIRLDLDESELSVLKHVSDILKVCLKRKHRLFFLILSAYVVLQSRFSENMRIGQSFSINLSKKMEKLPLMLLNIFENPRGVSCNMAEKMEKINELRKNRMGTIFFLNNGKGANKYFDKKSAENLLYVIDTHSPDSVAVIVNTHCANYVDGAFNVTIKDIDVDENLYCMMGKAKAYMARFMVDFADWLGYEGKGIPHISDGSNESCNVEKVFKVIYLLLSEYNDEISETSLAQKLGVEDDEAVFEEIKAICCDQDDYAGGEWILKRIGEIYLNLCSRGQCQKVFLKKDTDFSFTDGIITFVEKDGLLCIREQDMKLMVDTHMPDVPLDVVKVSLKEAGALECDNGQPYLKNFYIHCMKKRVRLMAIKKEMIESFGGVNL